MYMRRSAINFFIFPPFDLSNLLNFTINCNIKLNIETYKFCNSIYRNYYIMTHSLFISNSLPNIAYRITHYALFAVDPPWRTPAVAGSLFISHYSFLIIHFSLFINHCNSLILGSFLFLK